MFKDALQEWTPGEIAVAVGCPLRTAYKWRDGERTPPLWLQPHLLAVIRPHQKKTTKPNKPAHTIPPRRVTKRKGS